MQVFDWRMDMGATADVAHSVNVVRFGDGYEQRHSMGINNRRVTWSGTKTGDLNSVIKPIMQFIDSHAGVRPFLWTDPHGKTAAYTCSGYSTPQRKGNFWQISLKFEQFF